MMKRLGVAWIFIGFLAVPLGMAFDKIDEILWVTPEWKNYTDKDGTGIYNELIAEIFEPAGIRVIREYVPWKRGLTLVADKDADMIGAYIASEDYHNSSHLITVTELQVMFKKTSIPKWEGIQSLVGKQGLWYGAAPIPDHIKPFVKGRGLTTRVQALKMLDFGRGDYYLDNKYQMTLTVDSIPNIKLENYQTKEIFSIKTYWLFQKTERGEKIRSIFDDRFKILYCSGKLKKLYEKWNRLSHFPKHNILCE